MHLSRPRACCIPRLSLIWYVKNTSYEVLHYANFSMLLLLSQSKMQIYIKNPWQNHWWGKMHFWLYTPTERWYSHITGAHSLRGQEISLLTNQWGNSNVRRLNKSNQNLAQVFRRIISHGILLSRPPSCPIHHTSQVHFFNIGFCHVSSAFLSHSSYKPRPFLQHWILPCLVGLPVPFIIQAKTISSTWDSACLVGLPVPFTTETRSISSTLAVQQTPQNVVIFLTFMQVYFHVT
jgi:hypothetical protein